MTGSAESRSESDSVDGWCARLLSDRRSGSHDLEGKFEDCLEHVQRDIEEGEQKLTQQREERAGTERDIAVIDQEINKALLRIRSSDIIIGDLGEEVGEKESMVEQLGKKIGDREEFLILLLQHINEVEQRGFVRFLLSDATMSSYFFKENEYRSLRKVTERSMRDISNLKLRLVANIGELQEKRAEQGRVRQHQQVMAERVKDKRVEKEEVLKVQIADEEDTKETIQEHERRAAQIRNRLFNLRGSGAIPFGEALEYANDVHQETGVRPAFLLGLIKHESDLGRNVGTGTYRNDMHPTRDQPVFLHIVDLLGYDDPDEVRVSANPGFGWGGAMGPAQFIPSTWVCYGGLVNAKTGTCHMTTDARIVRRTDTMQIGDSGADVKRLQKFLNRNGFTVAETGPGSPGKETSRYGSALARAVTKFQERYASYILRPYNLKRGNGTVGPSTRRAVNQLEFYGGSWEYRKEADVVRRYAKNARPSNPWNPRDAFFASGIYLKRLGADRDECKAARQYYAGSNWRSNVAKLYCDGVLAKARDFQRDITYLRQ